jgi:hypothetical protein
MRYRMPCEMPAIVTRKPGRARTPAIAIARSWTGPKGVAALATVGILAHLFSATSLELRPRPGKRLLSSFSSLVAFPCCCRSCEALPAEFGSDHLAGMSIVTSAILGQYLAGAIVILMLSGGGTGRAGQRPRLVRAGRSGLPHAPKAHRKQHAQVVEMALDQIRIGIF